MLNILLVWILVGIGFIILGKFLRGQNIAKLVVNIEPDNEYVVSRIVSGIDLRHPFNEDVLNEWYVRLSLAKKFNQVFFITKNGFLVKEKERERELKEYRKLPIVGATLSMKDSFVSANDSEVILFTGGKEKAFVVYAHSMQLQKTPGEIFGLK